MSDVIDFRMHNGATEILLVRHADAMPAPDDLEVDEQYIEQPLSANGRAQSLALAGRLRSYDIAALVSSPMLRARQTLQPLATELGLDVVIDDRLREVALGTIAVDHLPDTATRAEVSRARLMALGAHAIKHGSWDLIPGTEGSADVRARATAAIDELAEKYPGRRVVVASHAGTINAYLAAILGITADFFFPAENTSISAVRAHADRRMLVSLNDVNHLNNG